MIKPAVNGNTVVSTLDVNVQNAVEKRIQEWMTETGSDHVGVVVMNPNNGEILAMAGESPFDLNNPREVSNRYTDAEIRQLGVKEAVGDYKRKHRNTDQATITEDQVPAHYTEEEIRSLGLQVAWNQEWRNFCVSDTFEPGSPSKIFTVAAALEEGIVTPNDSFYCDGYQEVGGFPIKCTAYIKGGHQNVNLAESLMVSCNDAMMQIAAKTGTPLFTKYQRLFGFGTKSGIDLPGEPDTSGLLYTADTMKPVDLATSSFGQTYNCTMVQMAAAFSSVINGGSYYEPHVVRQIVNEQGAVVKKIEPKLVRETVSESTSSFIRDALYRTVAEGTGKAAAVPGYKIGGKTGTAEKLPRSARNYLLSFCGFAPTDDPQVLVYVVVDVPHVEDQPHSTYASMIFQKIMSDILPYLNIFPDTDIQVDQEAAEKLPESEGITDMTGTETQEEPEESKVYDTEEYVDPGMDLGLPDAEASEGDGGAASESGGEGAETQSDSGEKPAGSEAESSGEGSTPAETSSQGT